MKTIIKNIEEQLTQNVPELKYIDENWGQLDEYAQYPPVKWPCAIIDMPSIQFSNIGIDCSRTPQHRQQGEANISISIANLKLGNTSANAPNTQKQQARSIWDIIEKVHACMQGFRPNNNTGALIRTNMQRTQRDDGVQEYNVTYSLGINNV